MKFNWGTGAFMLFGGFALFMSGLAIYASMQRNELVTEDYYEKELEFKEVQKRQERTALLSEETELKIENDQFVIHFPKEVEGDISGKLVFFKPSSQKDDKSIDFKTSSSTYSVDIRDFSKGMYKIRINWQANDIEYYNEDEIVIP